MANVSGLWNVYKPGEASYTVYKLIKMFAKKKKKIFLKLKGKKIPIPHSDQILESLKKFEQENGTERIIEEFFKGLKIEVVNGNKPNLIIEVILRSPEGLQKLKNRFKDMITFSVNQEDSLFCEKYYRHKTHNIFKDRLESSLEKVFHFGIQYKVLIWSV